MERFEAAHAIYQRDPEFAWWASFLVATLCCSFGERARAELWLVRAHEEAVRAIELRCGMAGRVAIGKRSIRMSLVRQGASGLGWVGRFALELIGRLLVGLVVFLVIAVPVVLVFGHGSAIKAGLTILFILISIGGASSTFSEDMSKDAAAVVERRYHRRLEAAREIGLAVDAMVDFGEGPLAMAPGTLARYELTSSDSSLVISYRPVGTQRPAAETSEAPA